MPNWKDKFPNDPAAWDDIDNDGMPDELHGTSTSVPPLIEDTDDDNDGVLDVDDPFPKDPAGRVDTDSDGKPDVLYGTSWSVPPLVEDLDDDNDGVDDTVELKYGHNPLVIDSYSTNWPFVEGFEARSLGSIHGQGSWGITSGVAVVQNNITYSGLQALYIAATTSVHHLSQTATNQQIWVDMHIRPAGSIPPAAPLGEARMYVSTSGKLMVQNGSTNSWSELPDVTLDTNAWQRLTLLLDYGNQKWMVWVEDNLVSGKLGFAEPVAQYNALPLLFGAVAVDDIRVGVEVPEGVEAFGGEVIYVGEQVGGVKVLLTTTATNWNYSTAYKAATLTGPGRYVFGPLDGGTYYLKAFIDSNSNGVWTAGEARGSNSAAIVETIGFGFDITLTDPDRDGDEVPDYKDAFPDNPNESVDTDGDGIGNNADTDDDGDGMLDTWEAAHGLDPLNNSGEDGPDGDPDKDGKSNWAECSATPQTDPKDTLNYSVGFESGCGYVKGALDGQKFWTGIGAAVQTNQVYAGSQALLLAGTNAYTEHAIITAASNITHEFQIKIDEIGAPPTTLPTNATVLLSYDATAGLQVYDATNWVTVSNTMTLGGRWVKLRIDQHLQAHTWDIWINGEVRRTGIRFKTQSDQLKTIHLQNSSRGSTVLDDLSIQKTN